MQYLLRRYATNAAIQQAIDQLQSLRQKSGEDEQEFFNRFEEEHARAGSPFEQRERVTRYIEGLDPRIRTLIHSHRSEKPDADMLDVVEIAIVHGTTLRENDRHAKKTQRTSPTKIPNRLRPKVSFADQGRSRHSDEDHVHVTDEEEAYATHVPGLTKDRPGWDVEKKRLPCWRCYGDCEQSRCRTNVYKDKQLVIDQYEALPFHVKAKVPSGAYWRAKGYLHDDNYKDTGPVELNKPVLSYSNSDSPKATKAATPKSVLKKSPPPSPKK